MVAAISDDLACVPDIPLEIPKGWRPGAPLVSDEVADVREAAAAWSVASDVLGAERCEEPEQPEERQPGKKRRCIHLQPQAKEFAMDYIRVLQTRKLWSKARAVAHLTELAPDIFGHLHQDMVAAPQSQSQRRCHPAPNARIGAAYCTAAVGTMCEDAEALPKSSSRRATPKGTQAVGSARRVTGAVAVQHWHMTCERPWTIGLCDFAFATMRL